MMLEMMRCRGNYSDRNLKSNKLYFCRFVKHLVQREIQRKQQVFLSERASREGA